MLEALVSEVGFVSDALVVDALDSEVVFGLAEVVVGLTTELVADPQLNPMLLTLTEQLLFPTREVWV